jgi:hypothetical protein
MRVMTPGSPTMPSSVPAVASAQPATGPDAGRAAVRFYVLVSKEIRHATGRPQPEIEALVFGAIRGKLRTTGEIDLRSPDDPVGKTKLDKRAMRLTATIEPITYARPDWQVSVVLRVERNSDGALLGEIRKRVLVAGVEPQNRAREDNLITTAIEAAAQDFAGRCAAFEEASFKKGGKK